LLAEEIANTDMKIRELVRVEINPRVGPVLRNILEEVREARAGEERIEVK
jgi:hypothetical protein